MSLDELRESLSAIDRQIVELGVPQLGAAGEELTERRQERPAQRSEVHQELAFPRHELDDLPELLVRSRAGQPQVRKAALRAVGGCCAAVDAVMAGEDFSEYGRTADKIPISIMWLGTVDEERYNAAKAAMISMTANLAREAAAKGVRVNSVAPGSIVFPGGSWDKRCKAKSAGLFKTWSVWRCWQSTSTSRM